MTFEFATATRILFGAGRLGEVGPLAVGLGRRALVVTGRSAERAGPLLEQLAAEGVDGVTFAVISEPTVGVVREGVRLARENGCEVVIGLGGGSVLDTSKAVAALLTNEGDVLEYLEVIGRGRPLVQAPVPVVAIPTTAGTGSEVTRNAVLASPEHQVKVSLRSPLMLPRLAVVDPELAYSLPPGVTASTGLDALTQVMEPYVSVKANPLTDGFCREGLRRAGRSLQRAYENGQDAAAREDMALASLMGGLALANAALGAVHGLAGPIGGIFPARHGIICAALLPHVMAANVRALQERSPGSPALARYGEVARLLTGRATAEAADGVRWVEALCRALAIPPLSAFGLRVEAFPAVVARAQKASSMKGNPIGLTEEELTVVLERAVGV
ncbi:MAG: iron-containing alcohol dehydrogenase [Chloroflexi bacterium]|nr:iron-containing alcohol dehydrogenase [Chloroflexota bacterium]MCI0577492.1 iron-containing alcohol dehydrogenase [Chloroflexota bacterium]MCI0647683.1 iron-containing alcohol dehydrogenase [Chloroflexota bacterium]MCI0730113.1 iron-containing alcohol dehydrogenase [Chloroflexota bacterium]